MVAPTIIPPKRGAAVSCPRGVVKKRAPGGQVEYVATLFLPFSSAWSQTGLCRPAHATGVLVNGRSIGSTGHSKRLEGLRLKLKNADVKGGIKYRAHVQDIGWEDSWSSNGETCGTTGKGKRLEAVQIRLYGKMAKRYDVYYRVHVQDYGWMAWAKNGAKAGTAGQSKRVEAVQVVLVEKGAKAPNKTYKGVKQDFAKAYVEK